MMVTRSQMETGVDEVLLEELNSVSHPLETRDNLDALMDQIGDAQYVLLGEASHGTSEYFRWRALISQRLIREKGYSFIAVEGDWPDCYRVNRYVKGYPDGGDSVRDVLHAFERWPTWMWANWEIVAQAEWMRSYNAGRNQKVGFYGLDVYSLWESMYSVLDFLKEKSPETVHLAQQAYRCFEPYGEDVQAYAWSTRMVPETCENEVVSLLTDIQKRMPRYDSDPEAAFNAEQNALVLVNAERYYRSMVRSDSNSWNVRDRHMAETLDRLVQFHGPGTKAIVWAHNTHIGDARYTDMSRAGMVNIGQLAREQHGEAGVVLVGFASHHGSVIAGREWDTPMERLLVPEAQSGSWEDVLHRAGMGNRLLQFAGNREGKEIHKVRGHRAIGVVYNPEYESFGNYVPTLLPERYDSLIYIDETEALHPLHIQPVQLTPPDTYPWGV